MIFNFLKTSYTKVKQALAKTRSFFGDKLRSIFKGKLDEETLDKLEQIFYETDLGVQTTQDLLKKIREIYRADPNLNAEGLLDVIRKELIIHLKKLPASLNVPKDPPFVVLVVGVNGNGKTTSVAKLAKKFMDNNSKVLIAAADTFRAAAMEQLEIWAQRINADIVKGSSKSDPAAVTFDAVTAGKARNSDVIIIDTAGRLHTKTDLMHELAKIKRSCQKVIPNSPHETLLVLDATTGQNAIDQAKIFNQFTPITGIILTKLDGTAKGGIAVSIQQQLGIPIKFIGVGEALEDLEPFDPENFVNSLLE